MQAAAQLNEMAQTLIVVFAKRATLFHIKMCLAPEEERIKL